MAENKTKPTAVTFEQFLESVPDERKRADARVVAAMMEEITGEPPVMWGPSIVGFGTYRYAYASGRTGVCNRLGFSPRSTAITIYFDGFNHYEAALQKLGRHTRSKVCLYVKRLADIDPVVLREMLEDLNARLTAGPADQ